MNGVTRGVIKQGGFVSVTGVPAAANMHSPVRWVNNGEKPNATADADTATTPDLKQAAIDEQNAQMAEVKSRCEAECEQMLAESREQAAGIVAQAEERARTLGETAERDAEELRKEAQAAGYSDGFLAGEKPGFDEGYAKGVEQCREALGELKSMLEALPVEKERVFREHENQLFDLIFTIANKVTAGCLTQKDKPVIAKMLKEAAKSFRTSSFIKVTLSKLDLEDSANVDLEDLARIFGEGQHVEFEVLKDAPRGTLILDNGSEIADAGISTQLKMIENLGKGKFKNGEQE